MSQRTSSAASWLASPPPSVAVEITRVACGRRGARRPRRQLHRCRPRDASRCRPGRDAGAQRAQRPRRGGADRGACAACSAACRRAPRRVALVLPDSAAKVSLLRFEKVPAKLQDLDQLIRWQMRKAAPFRIEDAQVSWQEASPLPGGGREYLVTVARRDIIESYERVCEAAGVHAGLVDIASFNQINAVLASGLVIRRLAAGERRRRTTPRSRSSATADVDRSSATAPPAAIGDLPDLVHQTAMYHEDRLGGGGFTRVVLAGASVLGVGRRRTVPAAARRAHRHAGGAARLPAGGRAARPDRAGAGTARHARAGRSASCCATASRGEGRPRPRRRSGWPSAAHQPFHAPVLQRARRPAPARAGRTARRRC